MVDVAKRAVPNADVICFMVDITVPPNRMDREIAQMVLLSRKPHILVLNKVDATDEADKHLQEYRDLAPWEMEVAVSARDKLGMETLLAEIVQRLPVGHRLYPKTNFPILSERSLVAEMIREKSCSTPRKKFPIQSQLKSKNGKIAARLFIFEPIFRSKKIHKKASSLVRVARCYAKLAQPHALKSKRYLAAKSISTSD